MKIRSDNFGSSFARSELAIAFSLERSTPDLGAVLQDAVARAKKTGDLPTDARKCVVFHRPDGTAKEPRRLGFVGLGKAKDVDTESLRRAAAVAQHLAENTGVGSFDLLVCAADLGEVDAQTAGRVIAEGLMLGAYRYEAPRKEKPKTRKAQSAAVRFQGAGKADFEKGLKLGLVGAEATRFARDIENMPGNLMTPTDMASAAQKFDGAKVKVSVLEERDMKRLKMMSLLGVSRGSKQPAKLIVMDYAPKGAKQTVCVVGKGLTFDSGGISIKPSARMDEMRYDMCGGGAVLGLFHAIAKGGMVGTKGKTRVVGIVPSSENMPDADAQKPGDVVRAMDGTTIEVLNTDAEGRLILADALCYAIKEFQPDRIVDLATLTGAAIVALGHEATAVMGSDQAHIEELIDAGRACDEPLWQLPLWEVHKKQVKSKFADIMNINSPSDGNGTISGAAFLSYFVGDTKWAHLDIAGTAWGARSKDYHRGGATGTAVRTLLEWCRRLG